MKKIGVLYGKDDFFPKAFIENVNNRKVEGIIAEPVKIDKLLQGESSGYAVIVDRISKNVPFYRTYLKNAAMCGTVVINNPFWCVADDKFFNGSLATKIGVPVPKTAVLPSYELPDTACDMTFVNLEFPLDWNEIFQYVGFPAYLKPYKGGGWDNIYKVHNPEEFFQKHKETGQLVMMLQEEIIYDQFYRCCCIGEQIRVMPYDPKNNFPHRYKTDYTATEELEGLIKKAALSINSYLGYDFNMIEIAIKDGVPYVIDARNPVPDTDFYSLGEDHFRWIVDTLTDFTIEKAKVAGDGFDNLTWGKYITQK